MAAALGCDYNVPIGTKAGKIAWISPSTRINHVFKARIERARLYFRQNGFEVYEIYDIIDTSTSHLDAIRLRCNEIHEAFEDPSITAIICTIGGETAAELLPHLDYTLIAKHPKPFCGYSDITLLHAALYTQSKLRTFYGPAVINEFGEPPWPLRFTAKNFFDMLAGDCLRNGSMPFPWSQEFTQEFLDWGDPSYEMTARSLEASPGWKWLGGNGVAKGRVLGGCLPSLVQLTGTPYCPDFAGAILLLETPEGPTGPDTPLPLAMARTCMADLRNAGVLTKVAGIVVGRPFRYDEAAREQFEKMISDQCYGLGSVPILVNVDVGHTHPKLTVPLGAMCELRPDDNEWLLLEEPVVSVTNEQR